MQAMFGFTKACIAQSGDILEEFCKPKTSFIIVGTVVIWQRSKCPQLPKVNYIYLVKTPSVTAFQQVVKAFLVGHKNVVIHSLTHL